MRYVKRITAFFLAVVVAVGCVGYRPQKAYANAIALSSEGFEVLFGLLGSAGVVVGIDKTVESRFEEGQKLFDSLSASQQQSYIDWLAAGKFVTSDTGHRVFQPDMELDTSWYRDLWNSISASVDKNVTYSVPVAGYVPYTLTSTTGGFTGFSLGSCMDSPFVAVSLNTETCFVVGLLPAGFAVFYRLLNGSVSYQQVVSVPIDTELFFDLSFYKQATSSYQGNMSVCLNPTISDFGFSQGVVSAPFYWLRDGYSNEQYRNSGIAWGNDSGRFAIGNPVLSTLGFFNGVSVATDELIPCDTWVSQWDDAKAEGRQVGIITGQDLSGYNTLDDIYNPDTGLVTGLDIPVSPEIPVTGDLTGIAGGIQSILNFLKGLIDKLIKALGALLTALFVPTDTALQNAFDPIMVGLKNKMDLKTFEDFKNQMQSLSSPPAPNITMVRDGITYTVVDFTSFNDVRDRIWGWLRGYLFVFILLYNMNFLYKLLRGQSMFDGMGTALTFGWTDPSARGSGGFSSLKRGGKGR